MVRLAVDECVDNDIVRGLLRSHPAVDVTSFPRCKSVYPTNECSLCPRSEQGIYQAEPTAFHGEATHRSCGHPSLCALPLAIEREGWSLESAPPAALFRFEDLDVKLVEARSIGITGISYAANIESYPHEGAGFAGAIYGPRAGLFFAALAEPPPGPGFRARPDSASATFEVFGAALSSRDHPAPTAALWFMIGVDTGL